MCKQIEAISNLIILLPEPKIFEQFAWIEIYMEKSGIDIFFWWDIGIHMRTPYMQLRVYESTYAYFGRSKKCISQLIIFVVSFSEQQ